jgi:hypothetical protein
MRYGSVRKTLYRKLSVWIFDGWRLASAGRDGVLALARSRGFGQSVDRISCFKMQQVDREGDKKDIYVIWIEARSSVDSSSLSWWHSVCCRGLYLPRWVHIQEKNGWRQNTYAPIGDKARYDADIRCRTWSICAVMTLNGWLPIDASTCDSISISSPAAWGRCMIWCWPMMRSPRGLRSQTCSCQIATHALGQRRHFSRRTREDKLALSHLHSIEI